MRKESFLTLLLLPLPLGDAVAQKPAATPRDPQIAALVKSVSVEQIHNDLTHLVGFGTRHTLSDTVSNTRGIGAARRWIFDQFSQMSKDCGGCLQVEYDRHRAANARTRNDTVD